MVGLMVTSAEELKGGGALHQILGGGPARDEKMYPTGSKVL